MLTEDINVGVSVVGATGADPPDTWTVEVKNDQDETTATVTNEAPIARLGVGTYSFELGGMPSSYIANGA